MPLNDGETCTGISLVTEALLEAKYCDDESAMPAEEIARMIYASKAGELPRYVVLGSNTQPIVSEVAIQRLASEVNQHYQARHKRLLTQQKAALALKHVVTIEELTTLLTNDEDGTEVFFGRGTRTSSQGSEVDSSHAFLVYFKSNLFYVLDSNDPGSEIPATVNEDENGLTLSWTCRYRGIDFSTRQSYRLIHVRDLLDALDLDPAE
jgi:hypothetical protein